MVKRLRRHLQLEARKDFMSFVGRADNSLKNDPKKFWQFVDHKRTSVPGNMTYENRVLESQQAIVNAFARYFSSVSSDVCCAVHQLLK